MIKPGCLFMTGMMKAGSLVAFPGGFKRQTTTDSMTSMGGMKRQTTAPVERRGRLWAMVPQVWENQTLVI